MSGELAVHPCEKHQSILSADLPWHRVLEVAEDCLSCEVVG